MDAGSSADDPVPPGNAAEQDAIQLMRSQVNRAGEGADSDESLEAAAPDTYAWNVATSKPFFINNS